MSTMDLLDTILVSQLPPVDASRPALLSRARLAWSRRRVEVSFERALRRADPTEHQDLLVLNRRR
jgi:hypothetical protein